MRKLLSFSVLMLLIFFLAVCSNGPDSGSQGAISSTDESEAVSETLSNTVPAKQDADSSQLSAGSESGEAIESEPE